MHQSLDKDRTDRSPCRSSSISRAVHFIEQNSSERVTLQALATMANLSLFRFATVFRRETGTSPHRYLCRVRVENAKMLLSRGVPLAAVASEAGFFDQSHFSRHFKSHCGMTPGKYLAQLRACPAAVDGAVASASA
ncbi:MAG: helix-turn-helix transcriptional regulator [Alphaproteobacteria bacterium]|nr:helix-turn-helix transcriptional regulator [Alphaproteobacteria bacterium]